MDFISRADLDLIASCAGKDVNDDDFSKLKIIYSKLKHICELLENKGFKYEIRQDPRRQAGPGRFLFQNYHWSRVYPADFYSIATNKFAYIIGFTDTVEFHVMGIKEYENMEVSKKASELSWTEIDIENSSYDKVVEQFIEFDKRFRNLFITTGADLNIPEFIKIKTSMEKDQIINLLKYKKQIILQGPPGTGKTRLAKELAFELIPLTEELIATLITKDLKISSVKGNVFYTVQEIDTTPRRGELTLLRERNTTNTLSFSRILRSYNEKSWNYDIDNNDDRMSAAVSKYLYDHILKHSNQYKIIQFHPSYSYEDFVRGIVASPNEDGDGILYAAENKLFAEFAETALSNYNASEKHTNENTGSNFQLKLEKFKDKVQESIDESGEFSIAGDTSAKIIAVKEGSFIYSFDKRKEIKYRLLFSDLIKIDAHPMEITRTNDVRDIQKGYLTMQGKHPYYFKVYKLIDAIAIDEPVDAPASITLKNYVLIIDEINRANLSSVLGELIYALEYRGEIVESIYERDGNNELSLPPNLFIIGTMNTADRSVGHIDYAIRRRFAFADISSVDLTPVLHDRFNKNLFEKVSGLFSTNLSHEFKKKDVQLGHSYFIDKTAEGGSMAIRLQYEIKPVLLEYVKDGILIGDDIEEKIKALTV
jgi:DNA polymerase III delta prime subunit